MHRIAGKAERRESASEQTKGAAAVLGEVFLQGAIIRGDVARIFGASPRTGQMLIGELLKLGLLMSNSPKGPLRLGFPAAAAGSYFPTCSRRWMTRTTMKSTLYETLDFSFSLRGVPSGGARGTRLAR